MKMSEVADFLTEKGVRPEIFAIDTVATNEVVVLYQEGPPDGLCFMLNAGFVRTRRSTTRKRPPAET